MKKAQLTARPIMHVVFVIVAILILVFGTVQITKWVNTSENIEIINFHTTLSNVIKKQSRTSYGSVDEKVVALPKNVETLCFVDKTKEISPFINLNLVYEIEKYENKNIFFEPFDKFDPIQLDNFELDKDENPLCLSSVKNTVKLSLTSKGNRTLVSTFRDSEKDIDCVSVQYNEHPDNSIDIVFLSYGYNKFDDFREDVNKNINTFLETEPFSSNKEKLNFYRIDNLNQLNCELSSWIKCDEFEVKKLASYCPNDYIIILADRSKIKDFISPVRSSAVSNMEKINTADNKLVVIHEFGHIFGGLADEYVDKQYYSNINFNPDKYPNCDTLPNCAGWVGVDGTGCFGGCSLDSFGRPTKTSIMRTLGTEEFGPLNEKIIIDKLNVYGEE